MIQTIGIIIAVYTFCRLIALAVENMARANLIRKKEEWIAVAVGCAVGAAIIALLALSLLGSNNQVPGF